MGRIPCCEKDNVKRGQWTAEEDNKLSSYITQHGTRHWRLIPKNAGLQRCGKSCRLRWTNYLHPDLKHGQFSDAEEETIVKLHSVFGNRWSLISHQLPGRTDNDVKNHWNTKLRKKLSGMGIDPVTHKPFSHLMAEIATTLAPPQAAHLAEAAIGCFKDEILHLLNKKPINFNIANYINDKVEEKQIDAEKIKICLSEAMQEPDMLSSIIPWDSTETTSASFVAAPCNIFPSMPEFQFSLACFGNEGDASPLSQSVYTRSTMNQKGKLEQEDGGYSEVASAVINASNILSPDCVLWDLPDDLVTIII